MRKDEVVPEGTGTAREIDRRTIAKGVAWTVPVVIVATAAPAAAASGTVTIQSVATTYVPASGGGDASVILVVSVKSTGAGNTISFSGLTQGGTSHVFTQTQSHQIGNESKSFTMTTTASPTLSPSPADLNYSVNGGTAPARSVTIDPVTAFASTAVTVSGTGSTRTFTFNFGTAKNVNSKLVVDSVATAGLKNNGTAGADTTWPGSATTFNDLGTGVVSVTRTRPTSPTEPSKSFVWTQTVISGRLDNAPFSFTVNAS